MEWYGVECACAHWWRHGKIIYLFWWIFLFFFNHGYILFRCCTCSCCGFLHTSSCRSSCLIWIRTKIIDIANGWRITNQILWYWMDYSSVYDVMHWHYQKMYSEMIDDHYFHFDFVFPHFYFEKMDDCHLNEEKENIDEDFFEKIYLIQIDFVYPEKWRRSDCIDEEMKEKIPRQSERVWMKLVCVYLVQQHVSNHLDLIYSSLK